MKRVNESPQRVPRTAPNLIRRHVVQIWSKPLGWLDHKPFIHEDRARAVAHNFNKAGEKTRIATRITFDREDRPVAGVPRRDPQRIAAGVQAARSRHDGHAAMKRVNESPQRVPRTAPNLIRRHVVQIWSKPLGWLDHKPFIHEDRARAVAHNFNKAGEKTRIATRITFDREDREAAA